MTTPDWTDTTTSPGTTFRTWFLDYDGPTRGDDAAIISELQAVMPAAGYGDMLGLFTGHPADIAALVQDGWAISYDENASPPWSFSGNEIGNPATQLVAGQPYCYFLNTAGNPPFEPGLIAGLSFTNATDPEENVVTTPIVDPNPPATQPDTTANGGSDFYGDGGGTYVSPDDISTAHIAGGTKETSTPGGVSGGDDSLIGTDSGRTVNSFSTSGTDGTTASGAVVNTGLTETRDTTKGAYDADNGANDPVYRAPSEMVYADNRDTTLTNFQSYVADDNDPNALPSGYALTAYDTTGVGTRQGGPVTFTPPGAPTGVTATAVPNRREVRVSWTPGTDPVGADVKRWLVQGSTTGSKIVPANEHETVMSEGLVGGQAYTFTVYAETDLGTGYRSAPSNSVTVSKLDITADVDYVEDDRSPTYDDDGTSTPKPEET